MFKSGEPVKYEQLELFCETVVIEQNVVDEEGNKEPFKDWDDSMKTVRMVRPSELKKIMYEREQEEKKRKEEAEAAAAAGKKGGAKKAPPKKEEEPTETFEIDESEDPTAELIDTIAEPEHEKVEGSERQQTLRTTLVCDYAKYECQTTQISFKPTLMYAQRTHKFTIKNTSMIGLSYNFRISNPTNGMVDAGSYSIYPKKGEIAPGCDEGFVLKFAPIEIEQDFCRNINANFLDLDPEQKDLEIEVDGIAERPVIHFELPPSNYLESKKKDMAPVDAKQKVIEFESLGTNIRNTRRFMALNPTGQGYEFEWEEIADETKNAKPLFKCITQKGVILSGKKTEMVFEYTPDQVGE
jgi:hydrocephalus-inducing protein